eukprot:scaffold9639_cov23-Cyclotella_meneghiniana.AAC.2
MGVGSAKSVESLAKGVGSAKRGDRRVRRECCEDVISASQHKVSLYLCFTAQSQKQVLASQHQVRSKILVIFVSQATCACASA